MQELQFRNINRVEWQNLFNFIHAKGIRIENFQHAKQVRGGVEQPGVGFSSQGWGLAARGGARV